MIEYLATAGAVGFAWATIAWREDRRPAVGGLALAAGLVGMLVKPTTAVFWVLPALAYRPKSPSARRQEARALWLAALVLVPLVRPLLWTHHADAIKAASPTTAWLTSDAFREWNFGTLSQRLDQRHVGRSSSTGFGAHRRLRGDRRSSSSQRSRSRSPQRLFWLGIGLAAVLPPLVFTNLYYQHDYYLAAVTPAFAALIGLGVGFVWRLLPRRPVVRGVARLQASFSRRACSCSVASYWAQIYVDEPDARDACSRARGRPRRHGRTIESASSGSTGHRRSSTTPIGGGSWSSSETPTCRTPHARGRLSISPRRGAERRRYQPPRALALVERARHSHLWDRGLRCRTARSRRSSLPTTRASMPTGPCCAAGFGSPAATPARIPGGERGTLILLRDPSPSTRVSVSDELAPLPARRAIHVGTRARERRSADDQVLRSGVAHSSTCATPRAHSAPSVASPRAPTTSSSPCLRRRWSCSLQPSRSSARVSAAARR